LGVEQFSLDSGDNESEDSLSLGCPGDKTVVSVDLNSLRSVHQLEGDASVSVIVGRGLDSELSVDCSDLIRDLVENWWFSACGRDVELIESNFLVVQIESSDVVKLIKVKELEVLENDFLASLEEVGSSVIELDCIEHVNGMKNVVRSGRSIHTCLFTETAILGTNTIREVRKRSDGLESPHLKSVLSSLQVVELEANCRRITVVDGNRRCHGGQGDATGRDRLSEAETDQTER